LLLEKHLKLSKKTWATGMKARSSDLSAGEKESTAKVLAGPSSATKGGTRNIPSASTKGDESGYMSAHVVTFTDSSSSSEEELTV
jgi:hypothetical protein